MGIRGRPAVTGPPARHFTPIFRTAGVGFESWERWHAAAPTRGVVVWRVPALCANRCLPKPSVRPAQSLKSTPATIATAMIAAEMVTVSEIDYARGRTPFPPQRGSR
jgi:hypothetical protein